MIKARTFLGQVVVTVTDVEKCSNFDFVSNNHQRLNWSKNKIGTIAGRSETFILPQEFIEMGRNELIMVVKSNSGKTQDTVQFSFEGI
jgi:hypothetical protein